MARELGPPRIEELSAKAQRLDTALSRVNSLIQNPGGNVWQKKFQLDQLPDTIFLDTAPRVGFIVTNLKERTVPKLEVAKNLNDQEIRIAQAEGSVAKIAEFVQNGNLPQEALTRAQGILHRLKDQKPSSKERITVLQEPLSLTQAIAIEEISLSDNHLDLSEIGKLTRQPKQFMDLLVQAQKEGKQLSVQSFRVMFKDGATVNEKVLQIRINTLIHSINLKLQKIIVVNTQGHGGYRFPDKKTTYFIEARETIKDLAEKIKQETSLRLALDILSAMNNGTLDRLNRNLRINISNSLPTHIKFIDIFKDASEQDVINFFMDSISTALKAYWNPNTKDLKTDAPPIEKMLVETCAKLRLGPLSYTTQSVKKELGRYFGVLPNANNTNNTT